MTDTFVEAHDERQHRAILRRIRKQIHAVLPTYNDCLESIEVEPIAESMLEDEIADDSDSANDNSRMTESKQ